MLDAYLLRVSDKARTMAMPVTDVERVEDVNCVNCDAEVSATEAGNWRAFWQTLAWA